MKTKLVTFVTDGGFLVPSLVAARQLVDQGIQNLADIRVYTIDIDPQVVKALSDFYGPHGIDFAFLETKSFVPQDRREFYRNHVPIASLARLSLHEVIEPHYEDIIYIDGDVQIVGDVSQMIKFQVPEGMIMAGRGSAWLDVDGSTIKGTPSGYLEGLGGVPSQSYFNAGVLAFRRATWEQKAPIALRFFFENARACIRHDQSALNAVFNGSFLEFAPKYNFHNAYSDLLVHSRYKPAIIHFTGANKPWGRPVPPWGNRFQGSYRQIQEQHSFLSHYLSVAPKFTSPIRGLKWHVRGMVRHGSDLRTQRRNFFKYLAEASFPF